MRNRRWPNLAHSLFVVMLLTILIAPTSCRKQTPAIVIDGQLDEPAWATAGLHDKFLAPWDERPAPPGQFRAFVDDQTLYVAFAVKDNDIVAPVPGPTTRPGEVPGGGDDIKYVARSDRVEVFFLPRPDAPKYYCIEVDAVGRVLDYTAKFVTRDFDASWNCPGLRSAARPGAPALGPGTAGYTVELAIPLATLRDLGIDLSAGSQTRVGVFWADLNHFGSKVRPHWLTLIDPKVEKPNFHVPSAFGQMKLGQ